MDDSFPFSATAVIPEDATQEEVETTMAVLAGMDDEMVEAMPEGAASAVVVKSGSFRDADDFHKGLGTAAIYRLGDGSHVLRLEEFRVTNGPDLPVIVSPHADPTERGNVTAPGYVELAKLKGNVGNQNYVFPADVDSAGFASVVVYCKPFKVIFNVAPLEEGWR